MMTMVMVKLTRKNLQSLSRKLVDSRAKKDTKNEFIII